MSFLGLPFSTSTITISLVITLAYFLIQKTRTDLAFAVDIRASADEVYEFLKEPTNILTLQPFITRVEILEKNDDPRIGLEHFIYDAYEQLPYIGHIGHLSLQVERRAASIEKAIEDHVSLWWGYLRMNVTISVAERRESAKWCTVTERLTINSPILLSAYVYDKAAEAHSTVLEKLKKKFEKRK